MIVNRLLMSPDLQAWDNIECNFIIFYRIYSLECMTKAALMFPLIVNTKSCIICFLRR